MDVLSPFISVLCQFDWLFHGESCSRLDVVHPGRAWPSSPACTWHCSSHYLFLQATPLYTVLLCNVLQFIAARCHDDYWVCDRLVVRILPPVTDKCATPLDEKFGCPAKEVPHLLNVAKELNINVVGVRWELRYLYYLYLLIETRHLGLFPNIALHRPIVNFSLTDFFNFYRKKLLTVYLILYKSRFTDS